jgi:hypothetical protein
MGLAARNDLLLSKKGVRRWARELASLVKTRPNGRQIPDQDKAIRIFEALAELLAAREACREWYEVRGQTPE